MSGLEAILPPGKGILPYYMLIVSPFPFTSRSRPMANPGG
jgi:hypothetical protein